MDTMTKTAVQTNVERVVKGLTGLSAAHHAFMGYDFGSDVYGCDYDQGRTYARVYYDMSNGQRMVAFFVDKNTGEVWKADGWKKPTKNILRGSLADDKGRQALLSLMRNERTGYFSF